MDDEDVQDMDEMWYRKASLFRARTNGRPTTGMDTIIYPTEEECVARAFNALQNQTVFTRVSKKRHSRNSESDFQLAIS